MKYMTLHGVLMFNVLMSLESNKLRIEGKQCKQVDQCSCLFDDGTKVDITSLGNTDGTPRFADVKSSKDGNIYSYNPCKPFKEASCSNAAACVQDPTLTQSVQIGDATKAAFKYTGGNIVVGYTSGTVSDLRVTQVIFVCDKSAEDPDFTAQGEKQGGVFKGCNTSLALESSGFIGINRLKQFTIKTVCACPNGCTSSSPTPSSSAGISGGTVILIVFICSLVLYFSIGIVVQKFLRKKQGKELIPNSVFWFGIPSNIKAGVIFLLGRCIPRFRVVKYDSV